MDLFHELFAICTIGFIIRLYLIFIIGVQTFVNIFLYILHGSRKVGHERWYFTYHFAVWVQVVAISASRQTINGFSCFLIWKRMEVSSPSSPYQGFHLISITWWPHPCRNRTCKYCRPSTLICVASRNDSALHLQSVL